MDVLGEALAKVLHRKRRAYRFTQSDVGQRIGVSGSYISSLESGKASPRVSELEDLAVHYRTTVIEMLQEAISAEESYIEALAPSAPKLGLDALAADLSPEQRSMVREFLMFLRERDQDRGEQSTETAQ